MTKPLYKTTVVIWTDYDPQSHNLTDLAFDAVEGDAYCSKRDTIVISDPQSDPDWDETEFFNTDEKDEEEVIAPIHPPTNCPECKLLWAIFNTPPIEEPHEHKQKGGK